MNAGKRITRVPGRHLKARSLAVQLARDITERKHTEQLAEKMLQVARPDFYGKRSTQLAEDMGSGAVWGDYDGDGNLDLYLCKAIVLSA